MRKENLKIAAAVCLFMMTLAVPAGAVTHYVSPGESIQAAIDDANDGDRIEVAPGTYYEDINFNGKAVRLYSSGGPEVTTIDAGTRVLLSEDFNDGDYAGWDICDQGNTSGPSVWSAATGEMVQSSNIYTPISVPDMLGTFAWWQAGMWWSDYEATLRMRSSDDDGIGVMFRYQDPNNYYRFSWLSQDHAQGVGRRKLVRCKDGQFDVLDVNDIAYVSGQEYQVKISAYGTYLQIFIDETPVLSAVDSSFSHGSIALYCWANEGTYFDNIEVKRSSSFHVVQCVSGEDANTILDGFTITGGDADGPDPKDKHGGGMYCENSSPMVINCKFTGNSAVDRAGGMYCDSSSPIVTDCNFTGNSAKWGGGMFNFSSNPEVTDCTFTSNRASYDGGGMYNRAGSSPTVTNCTFIGNSARDGGGMENWQSSPTVTNCTFSGNTAEDDGGGISNDNSSPTVTNCTFSGNTADYEGGGMYNDSSSPTVTNCNFTGNLARYGGGMYTDYSSRPKVTNCTFSGNSATYRGGGMDNFWGSRPTVTNCTFSGNTARIWGGGMSNSDSSPTVTNCTFSGNTGVGGGMYNTEQSSPTVTNCIFWGDSPNEIHIDGGSIPTVAYSDVQGGWGGVGNINTDPCFVDADNPDPNMRNLRLKPDSPCIDSADSSVVLAMPVVYDLDGRDRYVDIDSIEDTGSGLFKFLDMGAYEFDCSGIDGDVNCDGVVDFKDVAILCGNWLAGTD